MPGVWDALSARLAARGRLLDRVPVRLLRLGHAARPARRRLPHAGRDGRRRGPRRAPRRPGPWWWSTPTPATATRSTWPAPSSCGSRPVRPACSSRTRSGRSAAVTWPASRWCDREEWLAKLRGRGRPSDPPARHGPDRRPRRGRPRRGASSGPGWPATRASTRCSSRRPSRSASSRPSRPRLPDITLVANMVETRPHPAAHPGRAGRPRASPSSCRRSAALFAMVEAVRDALGHPAGGGLAARPPRPAGRLRGLRPDGRPGAAPRARPRDRRRAEAADVATPRRDAHHE